MGAVRAKSSMLQDVAKSIRYALDPVAWAADCLDWHADPWQAAFMRSTAPQIAVRTSRQSGKSSSTAVLASHVAIFTPGALILVISPSQRQATELLTKVRNVLRTPKLGVKLVQDAATSLELANGSRVVSLPSSPDAIRGYSAPALIIEDEAAWVTDDVHLALRPMLATSKNGRFVLLSTPAGRAGHFYEACHSDSWQTFKVTAHDCPRISRDWLEQELREHGDLYFNREYLVNFSDSQYSFFDTAMIAAAMDCEAQPLPLRIFT